MPPFVVLDHTADLSLRAWGADLTALVQAAAEGLLTLLVPGSRPAAENTRNLAVTADSPEMVLQRALRELLYLMEDEALAPVSVVCLAASDTGARLRVGTVPLASVRGQLGAEIKAVTRHGLEIGVTATGLTVTLVFDV